ncbi:MAG TPA: response regulator transcription factor [Blastocatellia bacterium]|nr:response regulator transcription factor [Blastocatellia bacterium]
MENEIRIVIADDHPVFRHGLRQIIESDRHLKIVAEADDGEVALLQIQTHKPDVVVLDLDMPKMDGFDVVRALKEQGVQVKIIYLSMHKKEFMFNAAMDLGVDGYILKDSAIIEIVSSIKSVAAGQPYISPALSKHLLNRSSHATSFEQTKPGVHNLTPTERRILKLIAEAKTSKEIGNELCLSHRTIENHRARICEKLNLQGSHALVKFAFDHKSEI